MTDRFNPPPSWPEPPQDGWLPPDGFRPGPAWGPVPSGWRLWVAGTDEATAEDAPLQRSEDVPASGVRPRPRVETYPVSVLNPGMWSQNHLEDEDYGFPPAAPVKRRPGRRLAAHITVTALGFVIAALVAIGFVRLTDFAVEDLPGMLSSSGNLGDASSPGGEA
ncbi:hypothetical protein GCM10028787_16290 [Brachybacterium horti]